jgi:hypothetical protein
VLRGGSLHKKLVSFRQKEDMLLLDNVSFDSVCVAGSKSYIEFFSHMEFPKFVVSDGLCLHNEDMYKVEPGSQRFGS